MQNTTLTDLVGVSLLIIKVQWQMKLHEKWNLIYGNSTGLNHYLSKES